MDAFLTSDECTLLSNSYTTQPTTVVCIALEDVAAAILGGYRLTGAISFGSCTTAERIALIAQFRQMGFAVTEDTGSFTLRWQ